jgi:hypothetical protein
MMIKFNSNQNSNNAGTTGFRLKVEVGSTSSKNKNICSYDMSQKQEGTVIKFDKNHNLQSVLQLKQLGEGGWEGNSRERFVANQF